MDKKITVVLISVLSALLIMSSGYGKWQDELFIEGSLKVIPDPNVLASMETELEELELAEELRIAEELRLTEELRLAEIKRLLDEQNQIELSINPVVTGEITQLIETSIPNSDEVIEQPAIKETKVPTEDIVGSNDSVDESSQEVIIIEEDKVMEEENTVDKEVDAIEEEKVEKQKEAVEEKDNENDEVVNTSGDSINNDDKSETNSAIDEEVNTTTYQ